MRLRKWLEAAIALPILLCWVFPAWPAAAAYHMQFANLGISDDIGTGRFVHDGETISRFSTMFQFSFYDQLDRASVAPNVSVTGPDGSLRTWRLDFSANYHTFSLYPPGVLEPGALYTFRIKGGPAGIKNADGAPIQADLLFRLTTDNPPFRFADVKEIGGDRSGEVLDSGAVLPRNASGLQLRFTSPLAADSAWRGIHVTRSDGQEAGWEMEVQGGLVRFTWPERLPRADVRYTVSIAGGEAGVRDMLGQPLPESIDFTVRTLDQPYSFMASLVTNFKRYGSLQTDSWEFQMAPGTLTLWLVPDSGPAVMRVQVVNEEWQKSLYNRYEYVQRDRMLEIVLPYAGKYRLSIYNNRAARLEVRGPELQFPTAVPAVGLTPIPAFTVENGGFAVAPVIRNPADTILAGIYQNRTALFEDGPGPDGTVGPATVDTVDMPDGLFYLNVAAWGATGNEGVVAVPLLVDRVDSFADVPRSHWARSYIEAMADAGVINGRPGGYEPEAPVNRAEFAKLLAVTLGLEASPETGNPFADVPNDYWAEPYIRALWDYGLITGELIDGRRYYHPQENISRAAAVTILGRALGLSQIDPGSSANRPFTDWVLVPEWAKPSVLALSVMGWVGGFPDGSYQPSGSLMRDQVAKLIAQFYVP